MTLACKLLIANFQYDLLAYSVSEKSSPLKLFAIFSLRLSIFPWNCANSLPVYPHMLTSFGHLT